MSLQPDGVVFRHVRLPLLFSFPRNVYSLSLFNLPFPAAFKGELVFTQKRMGVGGGGVGGGRMLDMIKTRAAVSILEWVTSFFAHSSGGLLGGLPAPGIDFAYFLSNSRMEISPELRGLFGDKLKDICGY